MIAYFRERNRNRVYDVVIGEFQKSGLSQAALARRLGKRPEVVSRLLGAPGNWTLDTVSDLMLAISGGETGYSVVHPLQEPPRNRIEPEWLAARGDAQPDYSWAESRQREAAGVNSQRPEAGALLAQLKGSR